MRRSRGWVVGRSGEGVGADQISSGARGLRGGFETRCSGSGVRPARGSRLEERGDEAEYGNQDDCGTDGGRSEGFIFGWPHALGVCGGSGRRRGRLTGLAHRSERGSSSSKLTGQGSSPRPQRPAPIKRRKKPRPPGTACRVTAKSINSQEFGRKESNTQKSNILKKAKCLGPKWPAQCLSRVGRAASAHALSSQSTLPRPRPHRPTRHPSTLGWRCQSCAGCAPPWPRACDPATP